MDHGWSPNNHAYKDRYANRAIVIYNRCLEAVRGLCVCVFLYARDKEEAGEVEGEVKVALDLKWSGKLMGKPRPTSQS
jgi:hypothetical protein